MAKYPYIADKRMYAAVMGACKWIRESGYFNKAVRYYANKYKVSEKELAAEIRKRQGAGQKAKAEDRKYKWFACVEVPETEASGPVPENGKIFVRRGLTKDSVAKSENKKHEREYLEAQEHYHRVYHWTSVVAEFNSKAEADEWLEKNDKSASELLGWVNEQI